jgi:hypothetical protein
VSPEYDNVSGQQANGRFTAELKTYIGALEIYESTPIESNMSEQH